MAGVLCENLVEPVEAAFPGGALLAQPRFSNPKPCWLDVTRPHSADLLGSDEATGFEYTEVLHDRR